MAVLAVIHEGNHTLATEVVSLENAALTKGTVLKGREFLFLVHEWFKLNPDLKPLLGLQEITDRKWFRDDCVFESLELWRQALGNNSIDLSPKQLAIILVEKMAPSQVLAQDVAYWRRLEDGSDQKSHEYLVNSMQWH